MANQSEIEAMYNWVLYFLHTRGVKDYTCALYNGNFSVSLSEAQSAKHQLVLTGLKFKSGDRILDVGAGLGPFLAAVRDAGGSALGLTLSSAQVAYCARYGLENRLLDWKDAGNTLGVFDGIASVGSFEHYCSLEEYKAGKQEAIYQSFFKFCADSLPRGGRLYLQTMLWGEQIPDVDKISLNAPKETLYHRLARLAKFYPGSWLPLSLEQIIRCAQPNFKFLSNNDGRKDYIRTLDAWGEARANRWRKENFFFTVWAMTRLLPRYATDADFRVQISSVFGGDQRWCFETKTMTHARAFFEKV